ncbi:hypothetical protein BKA70DRAFT_1576191, partial [Coprinopsis sp. MPI-PUGE-AT-0042]
MHAHRHPHRIHTDVSAMRGFLNLLIKKLAERAQTRGPPSSSSHGICDPRATFKYFTFHTLPPSSDLTESQGKPDLPHFSQSRHTVASWDSIESFVNTYECSIPLCLCSRKGDRDTIYTSLRTSSPARNKQMHHGAKDFQPDGLRVQHHDMASVVLG